MKAATAKISSLALKHNIEKIHSLAPNSKIIAVVKANAYEHGVEFVSQTVQDNVDCFGVARLGEALRLRSTGITKPILLLEGFFPPPICRFCRLIIWKQWYIVMSSWKHY